MDQFGPVESLETMSSLTEFLASRVGQIATKTIDDIERLDILKAGQQQSFSLQAKPGVKAV
jgi:hypothetical protein